MKSLSVKLNFIPIVDQLTKLLINQKANLWNLNLPLPSLLKKGAC